jgi:hypothetical protein
MEYILIQKVVPKMFVWKKNPEIIFERHLKTREISENLLGKIQIIYYLH